MANIIAAMTNATAMTVSTRLISATSFRQGGTRQPAVLHNGTTVTSELA